MNVNEITRIIDTTRRATTIVKIMPFVIVAMMLCAFASLPFVNDVEPPLVDLLVYQSPLNVLFLIALSYCLRLCVWHRMECLLPMLPLVSVFIDEHICDLSQVTAYVNYAVVTILFAASIVNAYFIFVKPNLARK